jgi:hypothetical protein
MDNVDNPRTAGRNESFTLLALGKHHVWQAGPPWPYRSG